MFPHISLFQVSLSLLILKAKDCLPDSMGLPWDPDTISEILLRKSKSISKAAHELKAGLILFSVNSEPGAY